jgi:hypothetical protein
MEGGMTLAVHKGIVNTAGGYNAMDMTRCFMAVCECILHCKAASYEEKLHAWFLSRQSKKYRRDIQDMGRYFGSMTCDSMNRAVSKMRRCLRASGQVNVSTMQVLYCETRHAINQYSIGALCFMLERYEASSVLRHRVSQVRARLLRSDEVSQPHTYQILESIREYLDMSVGALRQQRPARLLSVSDLVHKVGRLRICPKVVLEGIPEWGVLGRCMSVLLCKMQTGQGGASYRDLEDATRHSNVSNYHADGSRKSKAVLQSQLFQSVLHGQHGRPQQTGMRKRTFEQLVAAVRAAGGVPVYGWAKRRRMTRGEMEAFLE